MTYAAPQVRRKIEARLPPAPSTSFKPEPVLQEANYQHILNVIDNMTVVMEREEDIRQHYLCSSMATSRGRARARRSTIGARSTSSLEFATGVPPTRDT
jgi:hypothetical protein